MKPNLIPLFIALCFGFLIISCKSSTDCQLTENRTVKMVFTEIFNKSLIDSTVDEIYIKNLNDTVFYNWQLGSKVSLPLSQLADTSLFIISTDSINYDTIIFHYHRNLTMVSSDCGFNTAFSSLQLKKYTLLKIDTIITLQTAVSADVDQNYKIVLKPDTLKKDTATLTKSRLKFKKILHTSLILNLPSSGNDLIFYNQYFERMKLKQKRKLYLTNKVFA